jgi:FkbM family methyltransferase
MRVKDLFKWLLYPLPLRIKSGPLEGLRWIPSSGSRFIRGVFEPEKTAAIIDTIRAGDLILDIGAHVGYYTVLMSRLAGARGRVHAFEPRGINHAFLRKHVRINRCGNVTLHRKAVGSRVGPVMMETRTGTGTGRVSESGNTRVEMTSVDQLAASGAIAPPTFLKIDVEGGEVEVLEGAIETIRRQLPRIILATHGDELEARCAELLRPLDYAGREINQPSGDKETVYISSRNP